MGENNAVSRSNLKILLLDSDPQATVEARETMAASRRTGPDKA